MIISGFLKGVIVAAIVSVIIVLVLSMTYTFHREKVIKEKTEVSGLETSVILNQTNELAVRIAARL